MSNLSIKDVPDAWAEALRQRAARNHRSLQGELMSIIEQAANEAAPAASNAYPISGAKPAAYDPRGTVVARNWNTFEEWVAQRLQMYPEPIVGFPSGTEIIREERDSR